MANRSKAKGDKAELDATEHFNAVCPDLVVARPKRMLGAGRKEDVGDLWVFEDVAVQVKAYAPAALSAALYDAARTSVDQAANGEKTFALGMVKLHNARPPKQERWLATVVEWPEPVDDPVIFKAATAAADWAKLAVTGSQVARVERGGTDAIYVAPMRVWLDAYRRYREAHPGEYVVPTIPERLAQLEAEEAAAARALFSIAELWPMP